MTPEYSYPNYRCVSTSTPTAQGHGAILTVPPPPSVGRTTGERANERAMHADSDGPCEFPMLSPFIHAVPYVRSAVGRERPACSFNNTSVLCPCVDEHRAPERRGVPTPTPKALAQGGFGRAYRLYCHRHPPARTSTDMIWRARLTGFPRFRCSFKVIICARQDDRIG